MYSRVYPFGTLDLFTGSPTSFVSTGSAPIHFMSCMCTRCLNKHVNSSLISLILFFMLEFQWFFIVLSVLPSRMFAMSAHLFARSLFSKNKIHSSSGVQFAYRFIIGFRWLCHLSLHCLPILPGRWFAITVHFWGPSMLTRWSSSLSSMSVHGPLTRLGLSTFCHLCRHCTSVLPFRLSAILFQFLPPFAWTASVNFLSSASVQCPFAFVLFPPIVCYF